MLTRSTQVCEFYVMQPPQVYPGDNQVFSCDLLIYDEEADRHVRIPWADAVKACCVSEDANPGPGKIGSGVTLVNWESAANAQVGTWKKLADAITKVNTGETKWEALFAGAALNDAEKKGAIDVRIVIARPFIEHLMHSVILCVSGRDTGATLFGPADMQLSANTQVKTIECVQLPLLTQVGFLVEMPFAPVA